MTTLPTTLLPLASLVKNDGQIEGLPANPRLIKDDKYRKLVQSIRENPEMLALRELLVFKHDKHYVIIGGNMRYSALQELGYTEAPCKIIPENATIEQLRAYTLKDNSGYGEWDWDMIANDWDMEELDAAGIDLPIFDDKDINGNEEVTAQEDNFNEDTEDIPARCKIGDIWLLGEHKLLCGDSTKQEDLARLMEKEQADLWLTDPPYNVNVSNSQGMTIANDNLDSNTFGEFLYMAFNTAQQFMRNGAAFYIWFASVEHINFEQALNRAGLKVRQEIIWNKNHFILGRQDYQWKHEPCLYGWKEGAAHYFFDSRAETSVIPDGEEINIDKLNKTELRDLLRKILNVGTASSVMDYNKPTVNDLHPTMKPVELWGYLIRNSSKKGDIILDTFGGSGTTIVTAEQMNRKARCVELDPHYCDVIIARWEKLTNKQAIKL